MPTRPKNKEEQIFPYFKDWKDWDFNISNQKSEFVFLGGSNDLVHSWEDSIVISSEYIIKIRDHEFEIPTVLEKINEDINQSTSILTLKYDWDGDGASPIDIDVYLSSISFLVDYSKFIYKNKGIIIASPEINPCRDGTVDLAWHTEKARMLINFKKTDNKEIIASFYGDFYCNKCPIKGSLSAKSVFEFLAIWMSNLI